MSLTVSLTGRTRHRTQHRWFLGPVLVLQVEYRVTGFQVVYAGGFASTEDVDYRYWRDATVQDITLRNKEELAMYLDKELEPEEAK